MNGDPGPIRFGFVVIGLGLGALLSLAMLSTLSQQPIPERLLEVQPRGELSTIYRVERWWFVDDVCYVATIDGRILRFEDPETVRELDRRRP